METLNFSDVISAFNVPTNIDFPDVSPALEGDFLDKAVSYFKAAIAAVMAWYGTISKWVKNLFKKAPKSVDTVLRVVDKLPAMELSSKTAESVIERNAGEIDNTLEDTEQYHANVAVLKADLIRDYTKPLTQKEIKSFPSRVFLREIIAGRIELYTQQKLKRIMSPFIEGSVFSQYGLMATGMFNTMLTGYRPRALEYVSSINTAIQSFRTGDGLTEELKEKLDDISNSCDSVINEAISKYMDPFGKYVNFGRRGDGINYSSTLTTAKSLRNNVNGLTQLIDEGDYEPEHPVTFNELSNVVNIFKAQANSFKVDHTSDIDKLLQAIEYTSKNLDKELTRYVGDPRETKSKNAKKLFTMALDHLNGMGLVLRELCRLYSSFLTIALRFVNAYSDIVSFKHNELLTVLNYYSDTLTGFKKKAITDVISTMNSQRSQLNLFVNNLTEMIKDVDKTEKVKTPYSTFDYANMSDERTKKYNPGTGRIEDGPRELKFKPQL